jgi:predicted RNase H-like nuclease (RuvC/YqgF family)
MRFFQWGTEMAKSVTQSMSAILRKVLRAGTSKSSLHRTNHELRYTVELLKVHNKKLSDQLDAVKDENVLLWNHMEEMKEAEKAIMKSITDEYEAQLMKGLTPVGDA